MEQSVSHAAELVAECVRASGLSANEVARRAGVSPATVSRVVSGAVTPTVATVEEILVACGRQLILDDAAPSDPRAPAAARSMLDAAYPRDVTGLDAWRERLQRWCGDDPVEVVRAAAAHSGLRRRPGAVFYRGQVPVGRLVSAGVASGHAWALSGMAGIVLPRFTAAVPPASVLWCADPRQVSQLLTGSPLERVDEGRRAMLVVAEGEPELFADTFTEDGATYAAPIQIMLDSISLGGDAERAALEEVRSW